MTAKRYHDLDALRAVAMLLGIVLHGMLSLRRMVDLAGSGCEPIRTLWDSGHVHSWVPHVLVFFRERILYHDDVAKKGHRSVCWFIGSSALFFPFSSLAC